MQRYGIFLKMIVWQSLFFIYSRTINVFIACTSGFWGYLAEILQNPLKVSNL